MGTGGVLLVHITQYVLYAVLFCAIVHTYHATIKVNVIQHNQKWIT